MPSVTGVHLFVEQVAPGQRATAERMSDWPTWDWFRPLSSATAQHVADGVQSGDKLDELVAGDPAEPVEVIGTGVDSAERGIRRGRLGS